MFHSTYVTISVTTHSFNCVRVCQIYLYLNGVVKYFNEQKSTWGKKSESVNFLICTTKNRNVFAYLSSLYFKT